MKKFMIFVAFLLALIAPITVNAGIKNITSCEDSTVDNNGKLIRVCYIDINITNTTRLYKIKGKLTFNNSSLKSIEALDSRMQMTSNDPNNLVFISKDAIANEKIRIAKVTIYIGLDGTECNTKWQPTEYGINYSCEIVDNNYYDLEGKLTNYTTYDKQCNKHYCEIIDNDYFGIDGSIVDQKTYDKQCNKHYCEIIDNEYFGIDGSIVDQKTYDKQCNKHYCEIIDNEYYDNNGNIVSEKEYNKACGKYSCTIVDNEYYNSKGVVVSEKDYNKDCGKYSCVIVDNEYYDESGNLVDKATWEEMCTIPENPTTGSESLIATAIIGLLTLIFIIIATKKNNKLYKI